MERKPSSNNTALEKADKCLDEAGDEAKDFSNSVKKATNTGKDAYGKLSKLVDTAKKIGAALGAAIAAAGTACVATEKSTACAVHKCTILTKQISRLRTKILPQNKQ